MRLCVGVYDWLARPGQNPGAFHRPDTVCLRLRVACVVRRSFRHSFGRRCVLAHFHLRNGMARRWRPLSLPSRKAQALLAWDGRNLCMHRVVKACRYLPVPGFFRGARDVRHCACGGALLGAGTGTSMWERAEGRCGRRSQDGAQLHVTWLRGSQPHGAQPYIGAVRWVFARIGLQAACAYGQGARRVHGFSKRQLPPSRRGNAPHQRGGCQVP